VKDGFYASQHPSLPASGLAGLGYPLLTTACRTAPDEVNPRQAGSCSLIIGPFFNRRTFSGMPPRSHHSLFRYHCIPGFQQLSSITPNAPFRNMGIIGELTPIHSGTPFARQEDIRHIASHAFRF
jgi:hypothetical protein